MMREKKVLEDYFGVNRQANGQGSISAE